MTEQRHALRLNNLNLVDMNLLLAQLSDRLDKLEGLRGTPAFYENINMQTHRVSNVGASQVSNDAVIRSELDDLDVGVSSGTASLSLITPTLVSAIAGTVAGGSVVDNVQIPNDGLVYQVTEVAAVPGFNIHFTFPNVQGFHGIITRYRYQGSATHYVGIDVYNINKADYDQLALLRLTDAYYEWKNIYGIINSDNYLQGNKVVVRFYHYTNGDVAHDIYIDYIALVKFA